MTENTKEIAKIDDLSQKVENKFVQLVKSEEYPVSVREGINEVMNIIRDEKSITDLYPEILAEIPISQSHIQDQAVQMDSHFTHHRKLRQCIMEMSDRLSALYAAKTGQKKALLKVERFKLELENLHNELEKAEDDYEKRRWNITISEKEVDLEEAERGLKDAAHLIKDALLKVHHQRNLVQRYKKLVAESGLSYTESEICYYVLYFTKEIEQQLRSGDHQWDRGSFGALSQLPRPIRLKVLKNVSFIRQKLKDWPQDGDFIYKTYWDEMLPKKTGPGEMEGMNISEYLGMDSIKLLSKVEMEGYINYEEQDQDK